MFINEIVEYFNHKFGDNNKKNKFCDKDNNDKKNTTKNNNKQ